jgi:hypothetical protein
MIFAVGLVVNHKVSLEEQALGDDDVMVQGDSW